MANFKCPWSGCMRPFSVPYHEAGMLAAHRVNAGLALEPDTQLPPPDFVEPPPTSVLATGARPRPAGSALRRPRVTVESGNTVRNMVFGRLVEPTPIYHSVVRDLGVDPVRMRLEDSFARLLANGIMKPAKIEDNISSL